MDVSSSGGGGECPEVIVHNSPANIYLRKLAIFNPNWLELNYFICC